MGWNLLDSKCGNGSPAVSKRFFQEDRNEKLWVRVQGCLRHQHMQHFILGQLVVTLRRLCKCDRSDGSFWTHGDPRTSGSCNMTLLSWLMHKKWWWSVSSECTKGCCYATQSQNIRDLNQPSLNFFLITRCLFIKWKHFPRLSLFFLAESTWFLA